MLLHWGVLPDAGSHEDGREAVQQLLRAMLQARQKATTMAGGTDLLRLAGVLLTQTGGLGLPLEELIMAIE